jgi:hypothetical protein
MSTTWAISNLVLSLLALGFCRCKQISQFPIEVVENYNRPIHLHPLFGQHHKVHQFIYHVGELIALQPNYLD